MFDIAVLANTDAVAHLWHGIHRFCKWLFVDECTTATTLLSMSFSINTIFTGLSLTRFNISLWINHWAMQAINNTINDKFLEKLESLGRDNKNLCEKLQKFSQQDEKYKKLIQSEPTNWELIRRGVTIACAITAFIMVSFEPQNRIGIVLVCPYLIFLLFHALWVGLRTGLMKLSFGSLTKAMDKAEKNTSEAFDMDDCIKKLRENHQALAPCSKKAKATSLRKKKK